MAEHRILELDLGIDVYFCDLHSPWQKVTFENMNGLIRQYLPKSSRSALFESSSYISEYKTKKGFRLVYSVREIYSVS